MSKINGTEDLLIYKQYVELIAYTEMICKKVPYPDGFALVNSVKKTTYDGARRIIESYKVYNTNDKLKCLNQLDIDLKMIKLLIRVLKKEKYISSKNLTAWSKKLFNIGNLLGGWINKCQKA